MADFATALKWYERLLGSSPAFLPYDAEAVWKLAKHRHVHIVQQPDYAGRAMLTLFIDDLDEHVAHIAARGLDAAKGKTYSDGVRKIIYDDPGGNEIALGGAPL